MGLFNLFSGKDNQEIKLRKKLADSFDKVVENAVKEDSTILNDPMFGGMMIQASIADLYQSLKSSSQLEHAFIIHGLDYQSILDDECNKALKRYLE